MLMFEQLQNEEPKSHLINDTLKEQMLSVFSKLEKDICIVSIIDKQNPKSLEFRDFIAVVASLSPHIHSLFYERGEQNKIEELIKSERLPVAAFLDSENQYMGVKFHGVPGGREINSFVLAIYNSAGPGQPIDPTLLKKITKLTAKANIKVCVSLSCHYCPDVVAACQRLAILNTNIEAEMIDVTLYQDIVDKYKITNVPVIIVNDKDVYVGPKSLEEMVQVVKKLK